MSTRSKYANGKLAFFDPAKNYIWTRYETRSHFHEDFDTLTSIPGDGSKANGTPWVQDITGAGPPTVTLVADAPGGVVAAALTADEEAQDATIHFDDTRYFDVTRGLVFQCRARLTALPTLLGIMHIGLADDHDPAFVSTSYNMGFTLAAGGAVSINMDDNSTLTAISTGLSLTVNEWYVFRIECFDLTKVRYYINGVNYGGSSDTPFAATGANAVLQPFLGGGKASGAGVGTLQVDSVDIWQD